MKKRMIKLLSLALVVLTAFSVVGCGGCDWSMFNALLEIQPEVPSGTGNSQDDTTLVTNDNENSYFYIEPSWTYFPNLSGGLEGFEGGEVVILLPDTKEAHQSWYSDNIDTLLEEFVEIRNSAATGAINVQLSFEFVSGTDFASKKANILSMVSQDVVSDLHYYDIVSAPVDMLADTALKGLLAEVNNDELYFVFDLPCWNQTLVTECKVNGRLYFMSGATEVSNMLDASVIWHNKTLYDAKKESTDPESIAELAREGRWTYDELYKWATVLYEDSNGVPGQQADDTYGLGIEGDGKYPYADAFRSAWNVRFAGEKITEGVGLNGLSADDNRAQNAFEMVKALYSANGTRLNASAEEFASGKYMFYVGTFDSLKDAPNGEDTFELLPMPKYNSDQSEYRTFVEDPMVTAIIDHEESTRPTEGDATSAVLQLTAEESYMGVFGNFGEYVPLEMNSENNKIVKQIFENMQLTFENIYAPQLAGLDTLWGDALISDADLSNAYSENEKTYQDAIDDINRWFALVE